MVITLKGERVPHELSASANCCSASPSPLTHSDTLTAPHQGFLLRTPAQLQFSSARPPEPTSAGGARPSSAAPVLLGQKGQHLSSVIRPHFPEVSD